MTRGAGKTTHSDGTAPPSLEEAFERYQPELLGALVCLVGNLEDARDALQDSFLKCWNHRHQLADITNLKAWIFRVVLNTGRDLRGTAWRRKRQSLPEEESMVAGSSTSPLDHLTAQDELERIRAAVGRLREEEQEVFLLKQNADLTYEEIANTIGIPLGTVKTRMRMALMKLREILNADHTRGMP